jgi:cytochrome P450
MPTNTSIRWVVRHGLPGAAIRYAAARGNTAALLLRDPGAQANPFPHYDAMRSKGSLVDARIGMATASYGTSVEVLRSNEFFAGLDFPGSPWLMRAGMSATHSDALIGPLDPPSLLVTDPPDHTRYRRLVSRAFTPRAVANLQVRVQEIADELLDELAGKGRVDLIDQYAKLLPARVIAEILGVPAAMIAQFLDWSAAAAPTMDIGLSRRGFRAADGALREANLWLRGHFERLRRDPGTDILSTLVALVDDDGDSLTERELVALAQLLFAAGFITVVDLIGNGTALLLDRPDCRRQLHDQPELWPNAVEEILRFESPVQATGRFAIRDVRVGPSLVRQGTLVLVMLGGANRDPDVFPSPHLFDIHRSNARDSLAFSGGIHYCLGNALARMQGEAGLAALFRRFPEMSLAVSPRRRPSIVLRGYEQLIVTLESASGPHDRVSVRPVSRSCPETESITETYA